MQYNTFHELPVAGTKKGRQWPMSEVKEAIHQAKEIVKGDSERTGWGLIATCILIAIVFLAGIAAVVELPDKIASAPIRWLLNESNSSPAVSASLDLRWVNGLVTGLLILVLAFILIAWASRNRNILLRRQLGRKPKDFFSDFSANITQIKNSGILSRPHQKIEDHSGYRIDEHGTLFVTYRSKIKALKAPISLLLSGAYGEPQELNDFGDIKLNVQSHTSGIDLVYLPAINAPNRKEFFLVLLPELSVDMELDYSVGWSWPGGMKDLVTVGKDSVAINLKSVDRIPCVDIKLEIHEKIGAVEIRNIGYGGGLLENSLPQPANGYRTYKWTITNLDPRPTQEIVLEISKVKV